MTQKIKNVIIFVGIGTALILLYVFFLKPEAPVADLVSSTNPGIPAASTPGISSNGTLPIAQDFLNLLLNVKNIKLNDSIFSDTAFNSLRDSSIVLVPDGNEGRPNPFAPLGTDQAQASSGQSTTGTGAQ